MPEAYAWMEGQLHIYTGNMATSAVVAYATDCTLNFTRGNVNQETLAGTYYNYQTGKRLDVSFGQVMTFDGTIRRLFDSATAVHMKVLNSSINGTAGYMLYSGTIDSLNINGADKGVFSHKLAYHCNIWSGF